MPSRWRARARRSPASSALVGAGVPTMGHVGLTPQSATMLGGFKAQGRTAAKAQRLYEDAHALQAAGAFALVLEAVPAPVAARITEALAIPTIGIGAGVDCDGQVLVWHDLLGLYAGRPPRFVKQYADLATEIERARLRVRRRRPRAPLPGGAAHLLDAGGRAARVRALARPDAAGALATASKGLARNPQIGGSNRHLFRSKPIPSTRGDRALRRVNLKGVAMKKRTLVAAIAAMTVFGSVYAFAASLTSVTTASVGADNAAVASCDTDGVNTSYTSSWDATDKRYEVTAVTVSGIADTCDGQTANVSVNDSADASLGVGSTAIPTSVATSVSVSLGTGVSAEAASNIHVLIAS